MTQPLAANLTDRERELVQRLLGNPLEFPDSFRSWLTEWLGGNGAPRIPLSQVQGHRLWLAQYSSEEASVDTTSTSWEDLAGVNLTGILSGTYVVLWTSAATPGAATDAQCGLSVNGVDPVDPNDRILWHAAGGATETRATFRVKTLDTSSGNSLGLRFRAGAAGGESVSFIENYLIALRVSNL